MLQENTSPALIPKGKSRPSVSAAGIILTQGGISSLGVPGLNLPSLLEQEGIFLGFPGLNTAAEVTGVLK